MNAYLSCCLNLGLVVVLKVCVCVCVGGGGYKIKKKTATNSTTNNHINRTKYYWATGFMNINLRSLC